LPTDWVVTKSVLMYVSPAVSVRFVAAWVLIAAYLRRHKRGSGMKALLSEARQMRDAVCNDTNSSDDHKQRARKNVEEFEECEELEELGMELLKDEAEAVRAQLKAIR
jgi:hypothetical protein